MSFWFDPQYAFFLDAVQKSTDKSSVIRIVVPHTVDVYTYWAFYELVPRRILQDDDLRTPAVVAVYCKDPCVPPARSHPVAHGFLIAQ